MSTTTDNPTAIRKAAILMRNLEPEAAALLLAELSPGEARAVRAAIRELGDVDQHEHQGVVEELRSRANSPQTIAGENNGVELQLNSVAANQAEPEPTVYHTRYAVESSSHDNPFAAVPELDDVDAATLAKYLVRENAGVVAVVLSYLPGDRAAAVLAELPFGLRVEAMDRLAELGEGDTESLRVLAADLARWIQQQRNEQRRQATRMAAIQGILDATAPDSRNGLVDELSQRGRDWATALSASSTDASEPEAPIEAQVPTSARHDEDELVVEQPANVDNAEPQIAVVDTSDEVESITSLSLRPLSVPFEVFDRLEAPLLAQVMKRTPPRQLLLALAGATESLQQRIETLIPARQVKQLRRRLESLGPTSLREVEQAQLSMARTASDLWDFFYGKRAA